MDTRMRRIYDLLTRVARVEETISYGDVARSADLDLDTVADRRRLFSILDRISRSENRAGRPLLSAVVIGGRGLPGVGFFSMAINLGLYRRNESKVSYWSQELQRVHRQWASD